jgi:hypothetical protein
VALEYLCGAGHAAGSAAGVARPSTVSYGSPSGGALATVAVKTLWVS